MKYSITWNSQFLGHITAADNAANHPALKTTTKTKANLAGGSFKPTSQAQHDAAALDEVRTELANQLKKANNDHGGAYGANSIVKSRRIAKKAEREAQLFHSKPSKPPLPNNNHAAANLGANAANAPPNIYSPQNPRDRPPAPKPGRTISREYDLESDDLNSVLTPTDCQSLQSTVIEVQPKGEYGQGSGRAAAAQHRKRRMQSASTASSPPSSVGGGSSIGGGSSRSAPSTPQKMHSYAPHTQINHNYNQRRESTPPPNIYNSSPSKTRQSPSTSAPFATVPNPSGVRGSAPQTPDSPPNVSNVTSNNSSGPQGFSGPLAAYMTGQQTATNVAGSGFTGGVPNDPPVGIATPQSNSSQAPSSLPDSEMYEQQRGLVNNHRGSGGSGMQRLGRPGSRTSSKSSSKRDNYNNTNSSASPSRSAISMFVDDESLPYHVRRRRIKNYNRMVRRAGMSDTWVHQIAEQKAKADRDKVDDLTRAKQFLDWNSKENSKEGQKEKAKKATAFAIGKENESMAQTKARQHFEQPHIQPMGYLFSHHEELHALPPDLHFLKSQIENKKAIEHNEKQREQERDRMLGERQAQEFRSQVEAEIRKKKETQEKVAAAYDEQLNTTKTFTVLPGRYNDAVGPEGSGNFFFGNKSSTPQELAEEERREKHDKRIKLREMIRKNMEEDLRVKETSKVEKKKQELEDRSKVEYLRNLALQQEYEERERKRVQKAEMKKAWDMQCEEKQWNHKAQKDHDLSFQETVYFHNHSSDDEI